MKTCIKCGVEQSIEGFYFVKSSNTYPNVCKMCRILQTRLWREKNREYYLESARSRWKEYYKDPEYRKKISAKRSAQQQERRKKDPVFNQKCISRAEVWRLLNCKRQHSKLLCCSLAQFREQLESKFKPGMTFDNYGEWEVDHIIPLSSVDTVDAIKKLSHYTNLQPLWKHENRAKGAKI